MAGFEDLLNNYIKDDQYRAAVIAACKSNIKNALFALQHPTFLAKIDAENLYALYKILKTSKNDPDFYNDTNFISAKTCLAAKCARAIYSKNDVAVIEQLLQEEPCTIEITALSDHVNKNWVLQHSEAFLIARCNSNLAFALAFKERFPHFIAKLDVYTLKLISDDTKTTITSDTQEYELMPIIARRSRSVSASYISQALSTKNNVLSDFFLKFLLTQTSDTLGFARSKAVSNYIDTLATKLEAYQNRVNVLGIRKSKESRAFFAELNQFYVECKNLSNPVEQLENQLELYGILKAYMSKEDNQVRELYALLQPLYFSLSTSLEALHQQFTTQLSNEPAARDAFHLRRAKRIIEGYNNDARMTKSNESLNLVQDLKNEINNENSNPNRSNVILEKYNKAKTTKLGATLDLSLSPLIEDIRTSTLNLS